MHKYLIAFFSLALLLIGLLPAAAQSSSTGITEPRARSGAPVTVTFKNIPPDEIGIVNGTYTVNRSDGTIAVPYLNAPVRVVGKTAREIENLLRSLYISQQIFSQPIIAVSVFAQEEQAEMLRRYIEISGYVAAKKNLVYREGITLSEAILECGDITDYGSRYIQVTRGGKTQRYDYFSAKDRAVQLHPKDKVYVPARGAFESRPRQILP